MLNLQTPEEMLERWHGVECKCDPSVGYLCECCHDTQVLRDLIKKTEYLRDLLERLMSEVRPYCRPSCDVFPVFKEAVEYLAARPAQPKPPGASEEI